MNDKKHIDRLFQEKFKTFEATPDDAVWNNIHSALHKDKRKRRVVPFWWKTAGVAAVLALLFTVGNAIYNNTAIFTRPDNKMVGTENVQDSLDFNVIDDIKTPPNETVPTNSITKLEEAENAHANSKNSNTTKITSTQSQRATQMAGEKSNTKTSKQSVHSQTDKKASKQAGVLTSNPKNNAVAKTISNLPKLNTDQDAENQPKDRAKTFLESEQEQTKIAQRTHQATKKDSEALLENKDPIISNLEDNSIEDAIAKANPTNEEEKEGQPNRWNITPNVAPVYFNTLGKGSSIDGQFVNNSKSGEVNMSYGVSGSYAINDKIKVRAGINKVNLGYRTDGVIAFNELNSYGTASKSSPLQNINFKNQDGSNAFMSTSTLDVQSAPQAFVSSTKGALEQQFGYIEIPLEMEYSIIDRKFGLHVIGGFSTLFLNNNDVYSVLENQRSLIGEANNINSTSYSANFGLGFQYNVSGMLKLNLEPMFKYQINTFTNTAGDFRPYYIGVYTGFSFKF